MELAIVRETELKLLLEGIFNLFGYDFRQYAPGTLKRRVEALVAEEGLQSVSELQGKVFRDPALLERLMTALSIRTSGFFRNAPFYRAFRQKAVPLLKTYPFVRIWHAGCATGEEVYSMAILMREEGLLQRCDFYATDIDRSALDVASRGIYPRSKINASERSHGESGGTGSLSECFELSSREVSVVPALRQRVTFMRHNLVTDSSLNEFNVILCRNVLIYFSKPLQHRVHELLYGSLTRFGILGLGANESLSLTPREKHYQALSEDSKLYRRTD